MTTPPKFGPKKARWTLGHEVVAFWFEKDGRTGDVTEQSDVGLVSAIKEGGDEGWLVSVHFGPVLDLVRPGWFNPSQIVACEK